MGRLAAPRRNPPGPPPVQPPPPGDIHDYGVVGDLRTAALISRTASIDWACFPDFHSPSVFGRLLDRRLGGFHAVSVDGLHETLQRYVPGTNVLHTILSGSEGQLVVTDLMPIGPTVAPNGPNRILRILEPADRPMSVRVEVVPRFDYGRSGRAEWSGSRSHRIVASGGEDRISCTAPWRWTTGPGGARSSGRVQPGHPVGLEITWGDVPPVESPPRVLEETVEFWREWVRRPDAPLHRQSHAWFDWVERSELVLKLLSRQETGAFVAAPTTSLPEWPGGGRTWDYRYVWVRDAAFAAQAFVLLGHLREARAYVRWVIDRLLTAPATGLRTLYTSTGGTPVAEEVLDAWEGYDGGRPVRIGNAAADQLQLDIHGEILDAVSALVDLDEAYGRAAWPDLKRLVEIALANWGRPDSGIWEARSDPAHYVHSKVMGWVAADRGATLAARFGERAWARRWRKAAKRMRRIILANGYDRDLDSFVQSFGGHRLDAALLRLPMTGFLPWTDRRIRATVARVEQRLARGAYVYRYEASDGINEPEGAFLLCSFWLVECLARIGQRERAIRHFRQLLKAAGPLRLFSEEFDPFGQRPLGNYPQAFTHIGLLRATVALGDTE